MHPDTYAQWLETRKQAEIPPGFTGQVMQRVIRIDGRRRAAERKAGLTRMSGAMAFLLRAAAGLSLSALGLYRLSWVAWKLLVP